MSIQLRALVVPSLISLCAALDLWVASTSDSALLWAAEAVLCICAAITWRRALRRDV